MQRRTYGWDTHDIKTLRAKELSRAFDIHFNQDVLHAQPKLKYDHLSDQYEQYDSLVSRLQRDPRRETGIISSVNILRTQMNSQEFTHLSMFTE